MALTYRKDIDGLRAIAVLSVVLFHAYPNAVPGGFIGVDVFFVISGFLISSIIFDQISQHKFNWVTFYNKRIVRIFPALLVVLLASLISGYFLLLDDEYKNLGKHILASSLFMNNFILWQESGYFDISSNFKPLLHLWSLGIEEQFYFIWPLLIYFSWQRRFKLLTVIALVFVTSFFTNVLRAPYHSTSTFYLPLTRLWELVLGGGLAYAGTLTIKLKMSQSKSAVINNLLSILSLSTLLMSLFLLNNHIIYPGWAALLPTIGTAILLSTQTSWVNQRLLNISSLVFIGLISYPLYLWHWTLFSFAHIILSGTPPNLIITLLLIVSLLLAWLTYQFIEKPIRCSAMDSKLITCSIKLTGGLLGLGLLGFIVYHNKGFDQRDLVKLRKPWINDINNFEKYRTQTQPCEVNDQKATKLSWCLQTKSGTPNKVIWGDSHADHLLPGILKLDPSNNWLLIGQTACPPLMNVKAFWIGASDQCIAANQIALNTILKNSQIDTVVLASLGPFYINKHGYAAEHHGNYDSSRFILKLKNTKTSTTDKSQIVYSGFSSTIKKLLTAGKKVIIIEDIPEIPFMPDRCINRPLAPKKPCLIQQSHVTARQKRYKALLLKLKKAYPEIAIFNATNTFCHEKNCRLIKNNHLLYRDSHHLSIFGSELVAKQFLSWMQKTELAQLSSKHPPT